MKSMKKNVAFIRFDNNSPLKQARVLKLKNKVFPLPNGFPYSAVSLIEDTREFHIAQLQTKVR
jgi:hypothetical protein